MDRLSRCGSRAGNQRDMQGESVAPRKPGGTASRRRQSSTGGQLRRSQVRVAIAVQENNAGFPGGVLVGEFDCRGPVPFDIDHRYQAVRQNAPHRGTPLEILQLRHDHIALALFPSTIWTRGSVRSPVLSLKLISRTGGASFHLSVSLPSRAEPRSTTDPEFPRTGLALRAMPDRVHSRVCGIGPRIRRRSMPPDPPAGRGHRF